MTVIRHNSISGIVSITAAAGSNLSFYDSAGGTLSLDTGNINAGVITATTANFTNATVTGDLTVQGTTTTLDTTVTEVDKLEVGVNNTTVGVAITQSGTGDILRLYDGASQVVTVTDGGKVVAGGNGVGFPARLQSHGAGNVLDLNSTSGAAVIRFYESGSGRFDLGTNNGSSGLNFYDSFNGVERLRITSGGVLSIGETDPSPLGGEYRGMDVGYKGSGISGRTGNPTFTMRSNIYYDGSNWRYGEGNTSAGVLSVGGNQLIFEAAASGTAGATATISEKFRINSSGNLVLPSGAGIDFSATSDASGRTSELLDDYEEGTWTPLPLGLSNTPSWSNQKGRYTKIGRLVHLKGFLQTSSTVQFTSTSAVFAIGTLPFAPDNNNVGYQYAAGSMYSQSFRWLGAGNNTSNLTGGQVVPVIEEVSSTWAVVFMVFENNNVRGRVQNNAEHNSEFILEFEITYTTGS